MKWTDFQICKYYESVSVSSSAEWAVDMISTLTKQSPDEVVEVLQMHGYAKHYYEKKEKETMQNPNKAAIIKDYESGMSCKEIGERYGMNPHAVYNSLWSWSKKGEVNMRTETPSKADKPVHTPKEKEPAPSANDTSSTTIRNQIIPPKAENVKCKVEIGTAIYRLAVLEATEKIFADGAENYERTGVYADNKTGTCEIKMLLNDVEFILQMRRVEE